MATHAPLAGLVVPFLLASNLQAVSSTRSTQAVVVLHISFFVRASINLPSSTMPSLVRIGLSVGFELSAGLLALQHLI